MNRPIDLIRMAGIRATERLRCAYAGLLLRFGAHAAARRTYADLLAADPANTDVRRGHARALRRAGRNEDAARELLQCVREQPAEIANYIALTEVLVGMGLYAIAESVARQGLALDPASRRLAALHVDAVGLERSNQRSGDERHEAAVRNSRRRTLVGYGAFLFRRMRSGSSSADDLLADEVVKPAAPPARAAPRPRRKGPATAILGTLEFFAVVKSLILTDVVLATRRNTIYQMLSSSRIILISIAHSYGFWLVGKPIPSGLSYIGFTLAAFYCWSGFGEAVRNVNTKKAKTRIHVVHNIRWAHTFAADMAWDFLTANAVSFFVVLAYRLMDERYISYPTTIENYPLLVAMYVLAAAMGLGFGLIINFFEEYSHAFGFIGKMFLYLMFLTSGLFESYARLPYALQSILIYNPMMPVLEYGRSALVKTYFLADLNLVYSITVTVVTLFVGFLLLRRQFARAEK